MMKNYALVLLFFPVLIFAQNNIVSAGGDATGPGGSASYSIGQIVYHMPAGAGFSTLEGLQQPIEIIALDTNDLQPAISNITIYPNPASSGFFISFPGEEYLNSEYVLSDINGRKISSGKLVSGQTHVSTEVLPSAIYILKIKTSTAESGYKIIKR